MTNIERLTRIRDSIQHGIVPSDDTPVGTMRFLLGQVAEKAQYAYPTEQALRIVNDGDCPVCRFLNGSREEADLLAVIRALDMRLHVKELAFDNDCEAIASLQKRRRGQITIDMPPPIAET